MVFASLAYHNVFEIHQVVACISNSFPFLAEQYSIVWIYHMSPVVGHSSCLQSGTTMNEIVGSIPWWLKQ